MTGIVFILKAGVYETGDLSVVDQQNSVKYFTFDFWLALVINPTDLFSFHLKLLKLIR